VVDHDRGIEVAADSLVYDRTRKIGRFVGDITVRDPDHETLIKAGWLEYFRAQEKMSLQVGVRIVKNDIVCQSENADYDRKTDTLELTGLPRVFKKNDVYEAGRIRVNLKTEEILLDGRVNGTVVVENKHQEEEKSTVPAKDTPAPPSPGAKETAPAPAVPAKGKTP
jgi:lipopolysaccharide export system protein LptA